ncbi:hypothetical protein KUTeg_011606 [Tegillarca granosa]|uniref:Uncharacterized protein n=1 Tax=Tegillarca granosa TaxID=220873 RepID=A0ABQ9EX43_TEGGR|nr:hypothetical protein KUTeg_011606 [Tegillarca granosa]
MQFNRKLEELDGGSSKRIKTKEQWKKRKMTLFDLTTRKVVNKFVFTVSYFEKNDLRMKTAHVHYSIGINYLNVQEPVESENVTEVTKKRRNSCESDLEPDVPATKKTKTKARVHGVMEKKPDRG